jgi:hypothetical protein
MLHQDCAAICLTKPPAWLRHPQFAPALFLSPTYLATPPAVRADAIPKPHLHCYDQQLCPRVGRDSYGAYEQVVFIGLESSNTEHV